MRISVGIRKATAIAQTCVAKWIVFCETGFRGNKSKHKVYKNVVATGSAGPGRPAARTDSEGFFFLERATFTPTWMRPLPYSLSMETLETILAADRDELTAYELGLTKNAQQIFKYTLPGLLGNYMNERVFTPRDVYPADDVKMHLCLTGAHAQMSFMNL